MVTINTTALSNAVTKPMAGIAINKSLCKEYCTSYAERSVYLKDGQEFQLMLFNPTSDTIAVSISINGKSQHRKIVLHPGQRIWLDRFMDTNRKLKTDVYSIDSSDSDAMNAIDKNGNIELSFYRKIDYITTYSNNTTTWSDICGAHGSYPSISSLSVRPSSVKTNLSTTATLSTADYNTFSTNTCCGQVSQNNSVNTLDTARISEGSKSNQEFTHSNYQFECWPFAIETLKVLPESIKPITKKEIEKRYCPYCGKKLKSTFKFCPKCGKEV